jgi:hypothetical protein
MNVAHNLWKKLRNRYRWMPCKKWDALVEGRR